MRQLACCLLLSLPLCLGTACAAAPAPQVEIALWGDGTPPGSEGLSLSEQVVEQRDGETQEVERSVSGIGRPSLLGYLPAKPNGMAVIVVPGGSYTKLVIDKEGVRVARWLNARGISAFVLKHRLPGEGHRQGRFAPLQDAQRAIRLLRANATRWHLDPAHIGILGFSAGGHLAASLGIDFARELYPARDATDTLNARPDFMALVYGAAAFPAADRDGLPETSRIYTAVGSLQAVTARSAPAFILIAADDARVPPDANVALWQALRRAHVPAELHIVHQGGHGFALRESAAESARGWPALFEIWLRAISMTAN